MRGHRLPALIRCLGWDATDGGRYIPNPPRTPHIDALANGPNSIVFHRFYAGSGVCSPTRSAALTGRTPDRECIFNAEGCGQVRVSAF